MRRKEALAMIITLALSLTAGCAPGDISQYAAKAQRAGEAIFEGKTVPAAAEVADAGAGTEAGSENPGKAESAAKSENSGEAESAAESESPTEPETVTEPESAVESESVAEPENPAAPESAAESESAVKSELAAASGNENKFDHTAQSESAAQQQTQSQLIELPAMMTEVEERIQTAMAEKAEFVNGSLAGKDALTKAQQEALQAVLGQEAYNDKTLCLINSAQYEGQETGSFLLFGDSTALTARGKVSGDLWFYNGEKAVRILKNTDFMRQQTMQCDGRNYLLIQTQTDGKVSAQVYSIKDGRAAGCFTNAVSIEQEGEKLRVNYKADHIQYDPVSAEWSGGEAEITYFYVSDGNDFEQENIRELTVEQYLAYIQPGEADAEAQRFREKQEEKFLNTDIDNEEYHYSFFAIGDDRIGYRECRIGLPKENADETGRVVAEYTYHIAKLENGKLMDQCETLSGSGYYFAQWDQKKEELEVLSRIPAAYLKNRIDRAARTLQAKGRSALQCVQEVQEYDADGLCFVEQADYDGDGEAESFVTIGRYDGILCAPVCDLWFVTGENPVLLAEKLPVKSVLSYEKDGIFLFLLEGFEVDGAKERLYGVKDRTARRLLENASEIEVEENGDLTAWVTGAGGKLPYYYHILNGEVTEYGVQEKTPELLLDYENGRAVYRQLQRLADLQEGAFTCLERENGLIHVMITGKNGGVSYETYRVSNGTLVLVDCGDGGYEPASPNADGEETQDGEAEAVNEEISETEMTETETDTAE